MCIPSIYYGIISGLGLTTRKSATATLPVRILTSYSQVQFQCDFTMEMQWSAFVGNRRSISGLQWRDLLSHHIYILHLIYNRSQGTGMPSVGVVSCMNNGIYPSSKLDQEDARGHSHTSRLHCKSSPCILHSSPAVDSSRDNTSTCKSPWA
ncbi:hypothetical protein Mapa_012579 [Marchantia paleacea]|nr:hypothetical protein Mapa_012579 [Marchantia paleacea]